MNGLKFTPDQIKEIIALGIQNTDVLYEIICDCFSFYVQGMDKSITIDMYIALLKQYLDSELRNNTDIIFNSITFKEQKNQYDNDNDKLRRDVVVRSGLPCKYCKSTETIYLEVQLRSGDEGSSGINKCFSCGRLSKS